MGKLKDVDYNKELNEELLGMCEECGELITKASEFYSYYNVKLGLDFCSKRCSNLYLQRIHESSSKYEIEKIAELFIGSMHDTLYAENII